MILIQLVIEKARGTGPFSYARPQYHSNALEPLLATYANKFGYSKEWSFLEVTTTPLPQIEKSLSFYELAGFSITGGRKLKTALLFITEQLHQPTQNPYELFS